MPWDRGHGTRMMGLALERCFGHPEQSAVVIAPLAEKVRAHGFFERLDIGFVERRRFGEDECFAYRLKRAKWRGA